MQAERETPASKILGRRSYHGGQSPDAQSSGNKLSRGGATQREVCNASGSSPGQMSEINVALLKDQIENLSRESGRLLQLVAERDSRIEDLEKLSAELKSDIASKDNSLSQTRRRLADLEVVVQEKDSRIRSMEKQHADALLIKSQQLAAVREERDEEAQRFLRELEALKMREEEKLASKETEWEHKLAYSSAKEAELRASTRKLREENELLRTTVQKEKARASEAELATQRAVSQFETTLNTLKTMEIQFENLSQDAEDADKMRRERILQLEADVEDLRVAKAAAEAEVEVVSASASERIRRLISELEDARAAQERSEHSALDTTEAISRLKVDLETCRNRSEAAESSTARWREEAGFYKAELEQLKGTYGGSQSLLEATKLALESSKSELRSVREEAVKFRDAAEVAEANAAALRSRVQELSEELERERTNSKLARERFESELRALRALEKHVSPSKGSVTTAVHVGTGSLDLQGTDGPRDLFSGFVETNIAHDKAKEEDDEASPSFTLGGGLEKHGETSTTLPAKPSVTTDGIHERSNRKNSNIAPGDRTIGLMLQETKARARSRVEADRASDAVVKLDTDGNQWSGVYPKEIRSRLSVFNAGFGVATEANKGGKAVQGDKIKQQLAAMKLAVLSHPIHHEDPVPMSPTASSAEHSELAASALIDDDGGSDISEASDKRQDGSLGDDSALDEARRHVLVARNYLATLDKDPV